MARHGKNNKDIVLLSNSKAFYDYHIDDTFMAGIILTGSEVKSLRHGHANLKGAFITIKVEKEKYYIYLHNFMINPYQKVDSMINARRKRVLLLNIKEIKQIYSKSNIKGNNIVPLSIETHHNLIKVKIALVKGKKKYDKRQVLRDRAMNRDILLSTKQKIRA